MRGFGDGVILELIERYSAAKSRLSLRPTVEPFGVASQHWVVAKIEVLDVGVSTPLLSPVGSRWNTCRDRHTAYASSDLGQEGI